MLTETSAAQIAAKKPAPSTMEPGPIFNIGSAEANAARTRRRITAYINRFLGGGLAVRPFTDRADEAAALQGALSFLRTKGAPYDLYFGMIIELDGVQTWGWMCSLCEGGGIVILQGAEQRCPRCCEAEAHSPDYVPGMHRDPEGA